MSHHGMLTTVAYRLGQGAPAVYALEGAVSIAGQSVRWLRDNLEFFKEASEIGERWSHCVTANAGGRHFRLEVSPLKYGLPC